MGSMEAEIDEGANEKSAKEHRQVEKERERGGEKERELAKNLNGLRKEGCFKGLWKAV